MPYWGWALLAVAAGVLFGSLPLAWPWRRPHPVRSTVAGGLLLLGLAVPIGTHLLRRDDGRLENVGTWAVAGLLTSTGVWLNPNRPVWMPWMVVLFYGWLLYELHGL